MKGFQRHFLIFLVFITFFVYYRRQEKEFDYVFGLLAANFFNGTIYHDVAPPVIKPIEPLVQAPELFHPEVKSADAPLQDKPHFYMMGHWKEEKAEVAMPE